MYFYNTIVDNVTFVSYMPDPEVEWTADWSQ